MFSLVFEFYKGKKKEGKNGICIYIYVYIGNKIENPLWGAIGNIQLWRKEKTRGNPPTLV